MTGPPGEHPLPHSELNSQTPFMFKLQPGDLLYRHHPSIHDPIYFGTTGNYRFDDPTCTPVLPLGSSTSELILTALSSSLVPRPQAYPQYRELTWPTGRSPSCN